MLILTRRVGESVDLSIEGLPLASVKVIAFLPNNQVRLGFEADRRVTIMRDDANDKRSSTDGEKDGNR
jgi:carbon storage regulator CsrA